MWLYGGMTMEERIRIILLLLDEWQRHIFLAAEAKTYERGRISSVSKLSGVAPYTMRQWLKEIYSNEPIERKEKAYRAQVGKSFKTTFQTLKVIYRKLWTAVRTEATKNTILYNTKSAKDQRHPC